MATLRISGRKTVGTSAIQVYSGRLKAFEGILVKAASTNNGTIYFGNRDDITADSGDNTDGFPLAAGESMVIPIRNPGDIYAIGSGAGQKFWWMIV